MGILRFPDIGTNGCATSADLIGNDGFAFLFERFYKADRAHSGEGTGLGLSIVWEVLSLLRERIWVKSRDGKVTFTFTLPLQKE